MKKDLVLKCKVSGIDEIVFRYNNTTKFEYLMNILDEDGKSGGWYFRDVYKKINRVYWDTTERRLWLPKSMLYNKRKIAKLLKTDTDSFAFFNRSYYEAILHPEIKDRGMSGLMAKGASFW